jgi:hypothetical protein
MVDFCFYALALFRGGHRGKLKKASKLGEGRKAVGGQF